jgi:hypothetical protein
VLTELAFSAAQKSAVFGRPYAAWAALKEEMGAKIDAAIESCASTVVELKTKLDGFEHDLRVKIKWLSAAQEVLQGKSVKELMCSGPEGVKLAHKFVVLTVEGGPQLEPQDIEALSQVQVPKGLIL